MNDLMNLNNGIDSGLQITRIGTGSMGGKAAGLAAIADHLWGKFPFDQFASVKIGIPPMVVLQTGIFDVFMEQNNLQDVAFSDLPDSQIALAFQKAEFPFQALGELRSYIAKQRKPLAIRSSSLLEDALYQPFAGVYTTKMIPNNQVDENTRFRKLLEAIKLVYASTYFKHAKNYIQATNNTLQDEKMAIIIQEEVGKKRGNRFYPELSGVARSYNFYPMGRAKNEDGVVHLALGLGKTIVDGGIVWSYPPSYPKVSPPNRSVEELVKYSQTKFWALNMGEPLEYNPTAETEYMFEKNITAAELDNTLNNLVSTYDPHAKRLTIGMSKPGPRVLTFAPILILETIPANQIIKNVLKICEEALGGPVEIEFAMNFNPNYFGFLQVRPMTVFTDSIDLSQENLEDENIFLSSSNVLGNGLIKDVQDVIYIKPESFDIKHTRKMSMELADLNKKLLAENKPYLLIVFGRLGTTDSWLGIPINFGDVSGARIVVESTLEDFKVELSQGSHYFHNLTSLGVGYFSILDNQRDIDWKWLDQQKVLLETEFFRHAHLKVPLTTLIDGRHGKGIIYKS